MGKNKRKKERKKENKKLLKNKRKKERRKKEEKKRKSIHKRYKIYLIVSVRRKEIVKGEKMHLNYIELFILLHLTTPKPKEH